MAHTEPSLARLATLSTCYSAPEQRFVRHHGRSVGQSSAQPQRFRRALQAIGSQQDVAADHATERVPSSGVLAIADSRPAAAPINGPHLSPIQGRNETGQSAQRTDRRRHHTGALCLRLPKYALDGVHVAAARQDLYLQSKL